MLLEALRVQEGLRRRSRRRVVGEGRSVPFREGVRRAPVGIVTVYVYVFTWVSVQGDGMRVGAMLGGGGVCK